MPPCSNTRVMMKCHDVRARMCDADIPGLRRGSYVMPGIAIVLAAVVVLGAVLVSSTIKIVQEYERGVIFRLGRLVGARGPGLFFILPFVERMVKVDLRVVTMDVPRQ